MSVRTLVPGVALAMFSSFSHSASVCAAPAEGLAEALALTSGAKTAITEYVMNTGAWPAAGDTSVLGSSAGYSGTWVDHIDLFAGGVVQVTFKESLGSGRLQVRPHSSDPWQQPLTWICESPDIPDIGQVAGCAFTGVAFGPEVAMLAGGLKTSVTEYRLQNATWPVPADPSVIGPPTSYAGTHVARIDLAANGVLDVTLRPSAGSGHVKFTPGASAAGAVMWACTSPDIAGIGSLLLGCSFTSTARIGKNPAH